MLLCDCPTYENLFLLTSKRLSLTNLEESEAACKSISTCILGEDRANTLKEKCSLSDTLTSRMGQVRVCIIFCKELVVSIEPCQSYLPL